MGRQYVRSQRYTRVILHGLGCIMCTENAAATHQIVVRRSAWLLLPIIFATTNRSRTHLPTAAYVAVSHIPPPDIVHVPAALRKLSSHMGKQNKKKIDMAREWLLTLFGSSLRIGC
jgi:hypothetical protein